MTLLLSFDDGPSEWTPAILGLLAEHGARAEFFWVGQSILERPGLVERALADGHLVGGHTWSHRRLSALEPREAKAEIAAPLRLLELLGGVAPAAWRAPFFDHAGLAAWALEELGAEHRGAHIDPHDWAIDDAEAIARHVLAEARLGAVICLHDGVPPDGGSDRCTQSRQPTFDAVRIILEAQA